MPHQVSHPRLLAEVETFPLTSSYAYRLCTVQLSRDAIGVLNRSTQPLAESLEEYLRLRSGGMSLSHLGAARDRCWFDECPTTRLGAVNVSLADYTESLAQTYLARNGPRLMVRTDQDDDGTDVADRVAHWRWLSLRIPADLLVSALYARSGTPPADRVTLATAHLDRLLQQPVAETHLHVGAAFGFPLMWTAWMSWMAVEGPDPKALKPEAGFQSGEQMRDRLLAAAIGRVLLSSFLWRREQRELRGGFAHFEEEPLFRICERLHWPSGTAESWRLCAHALAVVLGTAPSLPFARAQRLYAALIRSPSRARPPRSLDALLAADPLVPWLQPPPGSACAETLFASRAMRYLLHEGRADSRFAELFWQYERIRCMFHTYLVQEPGTAGLDWFSRHFSRIRSLRGPLGQFRYEAAFRHQSLDIQLGSLEVRTSPDASWTKIRDDLRQLASARPPTTAAPQAPFPERGLVFHFLKERERRLRGGTRLNADPTANPTGFRFGAWFRERHREALALQATLRYHPDLLLLMRGLDVASTELAVPTWATAPLLLQVREASEPVAATLAFRRRSWRVPPLHITCHAGEDFTRLVEGLRRVHELCEAGVLKNGDRLGHGLALGTEPGRWADSSPVVVQLAEERLDDLLWELDRYARGDIHAPASRVERIRSEAMVLARRIYDSTFNDLDGLREARRLRHQPGALTQLGFPSRNRWMPPDGSPERFLLRHLTEAGVFLRGQSLVEVRADEGEVAFLKDVQRWLCAHLARMEVTVESNPSSNLLIGDMLGVEEHPVLRLAETWPTSTPHAEHELPAGRRGQSRLMVSINSDDPITFATCLADEYAYLYFALLRRHIPSTQALDWIDSRRAHGMRSRFTLQASANPEVLGVIASRRSRP